MATSDIWYNLGCTAVVAGTRTGGWPTPARRGPRLRMEAVRLFKKKGRQMADAAREVTPGMEPKHRSAGIAGYNNPYDPKETVPGNRFNFVRPDGKPPLKKGEEGRRRGFFA